MQHPRTDEQLAELNSSRAHLAALAKVDDVEERISKLEARRNHAENRMDVMDERLSFVVERIKDLEAK